MSLTLADPLRPSAGEDRPAPVRPRRRWELWRSPDDQPWWARPALLAIAAVAAALYAWNITSGGLAPFYSVAVKSMSVSWKAFFYGAFDPAATVTIDKLAGSFLPQALSARIFGFSVWSLALPQVIEGVIAVLVMYRVVRRWAGVAGGLLGAAIFALTPIAASMFGHSMEDGALTLCLVLAADAYQRAVTEGRLRSLLLAGVWVGLGFQAKMLQAWMVLPALAIGYLLAAPTPLRRRLAHIAAAGVVMLAVSLSWIALYTFTPAADRPYVDGSTNNSAVAMVFGYNGVERFGISFPGAVTSGPGVLASANGGAGPVAEPATGPVTGPVTGSDAGNAGAAGPQPVSGGQGAPGGGAGQPGGFSGGRGGGSGFGTGWTKLLGPEYGPEIGWLYPLALLALVFGLAWTRRGRRDEAAGQVRGGFVMWGIWLATYALIFSKMSTIPHTAYMSSLAPPLAALSAAGIVMFCRAFRAGGWRGWVLPVAVAAEVAWALFLWRGYPGFLPWARDLMAVVGAAAVIAGVVVRLARYTRTRVVVIALAAGAAAMLAAPAAWAASVLDASYAGTSFNASAGPVGSGMGGFAGGGGAARGAAGAGGRTRSANTERFAERFADRFGDAGFPEGGFGGFGNGQPGGAGTRTGPGDFDFPGLTRGAGAVGGAGGITASATTTLSSAEQHLYDYVSAHRDGASYLFAVASWETASPYIIATGQEVLPMGGFSGSVPSPTLAFVQHLVNTGQLKFFLVSGTGGAGFGGAGLGGAGLGGGGLGGSGLGGGRGSAAETIDAWVTSTCTAIPASAYSGSPATTGAAAETLYSCK